MFFEGSEKKFELISLGAGLRRRPEAFVQRLVDLAGAKIISKISSDRLDAYLLSESSLFVSDDGLAMLTCGRTTLAKAAEFAIQELSPEKIDFLSFERKNEFFPHGQETDFYSDVRLLEKYVPGRSFRFGFSDEHHLMLFHLDKPFKPRALDCTLEVLMYNLQGPAHGIFNAEQTLERVRELTKLDQIFTGFTIDDYLFDPCGYSLNAVRGGEYYTVHVTPEESSSYVSFETNVKLGDNIATALRNVVEVFKPRSFDVIYFHPEHGLNAFALAPYTCTNYVRQSLNCGFEVGFATYFALSDEPRPAVILEDLL